MTRLVFWYEFASTYSYLSAMRIEDACASAGVTLEWRPFLIGPIFAAKGWPLGPFVADEVKGRYMWQDMAREAARLGLAFTKPAQFPRNPLLAARIATYLNGSDQIGRFTRAVYAANFGADRDVADPAVLAALLEDMGLDPEATIAGAKSDETKAALRATTQGAEAAGLFGAPSFTVGETLFWGNDRLQSAIDQARAG